MGKQKSSKTVRCTYFTWKIFRRNSVYYADGRSGDRNLGKHSLNAKSENDAIQSLQKLDRSKARNLGLIQDEPTAQVPVEEKEPITIEEGWEKFLEYCFRPREMGGVSRNTRKKYKSVKDKHIAFCQNSGIRTWQDFNKKRAADYILWLEKQRTVAPRTKYFELMLLVSISKWLVAEDLLGERFRLRLKLVTPEGTDTYCYNRQEVRRMLEFCQESKAGQWIRPILLTLATTGMRIGELISLRWEDIDFDAATIRIVDNRFSRFQVETGMTRTTKGKRSRSLPLHPDLKEVLSTMKRHPDGFVFHGAKGARLRDRRVLEIFQRKIRDPLKEEFPVSAGEIGFYRGAIHSFRHYFVSECFRQGATEVEVMDWVGHKDSEMVHHYRHLRPDDSQRRMQSINFV